MALRKMARWMDSVDERILEYLDETDGAVTAWEIAHDLEGTTRLRARERCRVLARAGFTVVVPREPLTEKYDITGCGQRYLLGEVDAKHRRPLPAARPPEAVRPGWYAGFG
ncbi:hypothetical protein SY89_02250 [Halolamina pelagica]|uniref:Uncharacterized protein n=1 Tax=Halolamina pelagica TaxID=699431 RepID=A0A0P7H0A0_9EURY|nr:hypothetical protein SY89_02250 [Halolamina pelagica]